MTITCKTCKKDLPQHAFSKIQRKNTSTYRLSCKTCETSKARSRRTENKKTAHEKSTDPAFFKDDKDAQMPNDSDLLFWSTPFYDDIVAGREVLMNRIPEDDKAK